MWQDHVGRALSKQTGSAIGWKDAGAGLEAEERKTMHNL